MRFPLRAAPLARVEKIAAWLDEVGVVDPNTGDLRPAVDQLRRWLGTAKQLRADVGLSARSRAELHARRSAVDPAAADLEAGRRLRAQEES
jgi:hypothetical protein